MNHVNAHVRTPDSRRGPFSATERYAPRPPVLVVDDDSLMNELVATFVRECGYEAIQQANGYDALNWWRQHAAALIITDLEMPMMDGWEFCDQVAATADQVPPPVIIMTGLLHLVRRPSLGRVVLYKPFSMDALEVAIHTSLFPPNERSPSSAPNQGRVPNWPSPSPPRKFLASNE